MIDEYFLTTSILGCAWAFIFKIGFLFQSNFSDHIISLICYIKIPLWINGSNLFQSSKLWKSCIYIGVGYNRNMKS